MNSFYNQLSANWSSNLFFTVVGTICGFVLTELYQHLKQRRTKMRRYSALTKSLERIRDSEVKLDVITLGVGSWRLGEDIHVHDTGRSFFISFPSQHVPALTDRYNAEGKELSDCFELNQEQFLDGNSDPQFVASESGIPEFGKLLEQCRAEVAEDFLYGRNGCYFNHNKYGVYSLQTFLRPGKHESPHLTLHIYTTDYFTHKVMRRVYKALKIRGHPITQVDDQKGLEQYRHFTTSIGLNAVIILTNEEEGSTFVVTQRSMAASETDGKKFYHVTMNEGMSVLDYDPDERRVSFKRWLERGLNEELNLNSDWVHAHLKSSSFDDVFLVRGLFEIGIVATIAAEGTTVDELWARARFAKDRKLEVDGLAGVPCTRENLISFLDRHEMIPHGRYALVRVAARAGIAVGESWWVNTPSGILGALRR